MRSALTASTLAALLLGTTALTASAEPVFNRIASFAVPQNMPADMDRKSVSSAEIITATADGMMLIYSDSPLGVIGMIDIADPAHPKAGGVVKMDGEPTPVAVAGDLVMVGVNTSKSFTEPSGKLLAVDPKTKAIKATCDLGGQPDSVAVAKDGSFIAIAIENERDEEVDKGAIPQMPAGYLAIVPLSAGMPACDQLKKVDVTGLAEVAGDDPEPEFVAINDAGEIALTMQENNHIVIVDGKSGKVTSHFSAGTVDLDNVDTAEEGALTFDGKLTGVPREPDAVKWLDNNRLVIANEGDWKGGSRGFTIFDKAGKVLFESGLDFEYRVAMAGHYPEGRSGNKGAEPEGLEVGKFGNDTLIFVLAERASVVGVYRDTGSAPAFLQLLPSGLSPEGAIAIPSRNLLATANELDLVEDGLVRAHVMIYQRAEGAAAYPQIVSGMDANGRPVGWAALSGAVADPEKPGILYVVNDSAFGMQPTIFVVDANQKPAKITDAIRVTRGGQPAQKLDLEGITTDGQGGFWLASEGRTDRLIPHALYRVNAKGEIKQEVAFPDALLASEIRFGSEGVAMVDGKLWIAIQRSWKDDPKNTVKLVSYDPKSKEWGAVRYPLETAGEGWVGLSEITAHGDHVYIVERDNQIGDAAKLKKLYRVAKADLKPAKIGGDLPTVKKEEVHDFIPDLKKLNGFVVDKIESFAVDAAGTGYVITDNDGVDDSSGETYFFSIGKM